MTRVLALADEVADVLYTPRLRALGPEVVVACGDLPFDYLEYVVTMLNVPLLYVPGNHDPDLSPTREQVAPGELLSPFLSAQLDRLPGPQGCTNIDGRVIEAAGLLIAGLGGSLRYSPGPNQYTQSEMRRRVLRLALRLARRRLRGGRALDVLVTHAPPLHVGDGKDAAHQGFEALHTVVKKWAPKMLVHGHVHPYGQLQEDRVVGATKVVNAVAYRTLEVPT